MRKRDFTGASLILSLAGFALARGAVCAENPAEQLEAPAVEVIGDTVNWDLIPTSAISTINLIPGSNPLFGLNTLGGALSIRTKSGAQYPGTAATLYGGSFGRRAAEAQHGGSNGEFDYFASASGFREDGWRAQSPSDVRQFFSKLGWEDGTTDIDFGITHGETDVGGNGLLPQSMLRADPNHAYTLRDNTRNPITLLPLNATRWLSGDRLWSSTAYFRQSEKNTSSGDVNQVSDARNNVMAYEDGDPNASSVNRTRTSQRG